MPITYEPYVMTIGSETTIYQNEVKCTVLENEMNYSQNPTVFKSSTIFTGSLYAPIHAPVSGSPVFGVIIDGTLADNVTGSSFSPYVTTVGLYNDANELLVVGKLATPYPIPQNSDITFVVKWDS